MSRTSHNGCRGVNQRAKQKRSSANARLRNITENDASAMIGIGSFAGNVKMLSGNQFAVLPQESSDEELDSIISDSDGGNKSASASLAR